MRTLVTGSGGFVGGHLLRHLEACGDDIVRWDGPPASPDVADRDAMADALESLELDVVYHLAGQARVDLSWSEPGTTLQVNAAGTANLLDALHQTNPHARVVVMSSAEVYGRVTPDMVPVGEAAATVPRTPYGVSKLAAEQVALLLGSTRDQHVVICRPFNQIGPGQSDKFVTSAFARRIVDNERSGNRELRVGNLSATRDFLDVRDAVAAYRAVAEHGERGEIYNVCAGTESSIRSVLDALIAHSTGAHEVVVDPELHRPNDMERMFGSAARLKAATGWEPTRTVEQSLGDVLSNWREQGEIAVT